MPASQRTATHRTTAQRSADPAPSLPAEEPTPSPIERQVERLAGKAEVLRVQYPKTAALMDRLSFAAEWPKDNVGRQGIERAIGEQDLDDLAKRVEASFAANGRPWLGWHREAIAGLSRPGRGVQALPPNYAAEF